MVGYPTVWIQMVNTNKCAFSVTTNLLDPRNITWPWP